MGLVGDTIKKSSRIPGLGKLLIFEVIALAYFFHLIGKFLNTPFTWSLILTVSFSLFAVIGFGYLIYCKYEASPRRKKRKSSIKKK